MNKWCPLTGFAGNPGRLRSIAPVPKKRVKAWLYRKFFPRLHSRMRRHFFRARSGLHGVAMGSQRSVATRAAQGILWLGRRAFDFHCAVIPLPGPDGHQDGVFDAHQVQSARRPRLSPAARHYSRDLDRPLGDAFEAGALPSEGWPVPGVADWRHPCSNSMLPCSKFAACRSC
jgi:hypothetical protein